MARVMVVFLLISIVLIEELQAQKVIEITTGGKSIPKKNPPPSPADKCRFINGPSVNEGFPQLFVNKTWGYICDEPGFKPENWPTVFCKTKFGSNWHATLAEYRPLKKPGPIALENICCFPKYTMNIFEYPCYDPTRKCRGKIYEKIMWIRCEQI